MTIAGVDLVAYDPSRHQRQGCPTLPPFAGVDSVSYDPSRHQRFEWSAARRRDNHPTGDERGGGAATGGSTSEVALHLKRQ
jgi:hypothetical protein